MNENEFDMTARAWLEDGPTQMSERGLLSALEEIHTTRQRRAVWPAWRATPVRVLGRGGPTFQRLSLAVATGGAAIVLIAAGTVLLSNPPRSTDGPAAASPTSSPSGPTTSGGMWPQSTLDDVRAAQKRADAGDPDYSWQVGARVVEDDPFTQVDAELVDRFMREVLGWESYKFREMDSGTSVGWNDAGNWVEGTVTGQRYLRCAPGRTNPLYPDESCAPTLDDLRYEAVSFDLAQLDRQGPDGIWVVSRWRLTAPFAQVDPAVAEAQATERLGEFLAARVAGNSAERYVEVDGHEDVPLLYGTTSGAPYERYEIERLDRPGWPDGWMTLSARLFADGDKTVVEQGIVGLPGFRLRLDANSTTENGKPVALSYTSADGEVTVSAPGPWSMWWPGAAHVADVGVWFGLMKPDSDESGIRIGFVDPVAYDAWCAANGGSPLLSAPADAAAIAQQLMADPDFETTEPVTTTIGGLEAVSMDVALAPAGEACIVGRIEISRWIHELVGEQSESRLRLYLVDLPEDMSVDTLAITVLAPEERFEEVIAETAPIVDSIEFHRGD
jgi:hypothetical protein